MKHPTPDQVVQALQFLDQDRKRVLALRKASKVAKSDRYHLQPWYVKLWRLRKLLFVPYCALKFWYYSKFSLKEFYGDMSFGNCWSLARGDADIAMRRF
jgi:hypothetical protein